MEKGINVIDPSNVDFKVLKRTGYTILISQTEKLDLQLNPAT